MSKKNQDDYLQDLQDWQNHQYSPGYYTGGRIPPQIKHGRKRMGYYYLIVGVYASFIFIFTLFSSNGSINWRNLLLLLWPACLVAVAIRFFHREKEHREVHKKKHKRKRRKK